MHSHFEFWTALWGWNQSSYRGEFRAQQGSIRKRLCPDEISSSEYWAFDVLNFRKRSSFECVAISEISSLNRPLISLRLSSGRVATDSSIQNMVSPTRVVESIIPLADQKRLDLVDFGNPERWTVERRMRISFRGKQPSSLNAFSHRLSFKLAQNYCPRSITKNFNKLRKHNYFHVHLVDVN